MTGPVTLASRPELMQQLAVHAEGFDSTCEHTEVFCPCCGRKTAADTIVSLDGLKTEFKGGNHLPKRDHDWACDGGLHLLVADRTNGWTWSNLTRAIGSPDEVVRHYRARELLRKAEEDHRTKHKPGDPWFDPGAEFEKAHRSLPQDTREIPGTERPDV